MPFLCSLEMLRAALGVSLTNQSDKSMQIRVRELGLHLFHHLGPGDLGRNLPPGRSSGSVARPLIFRYIDHIFDLIDRIVSPPLLSNSQLKPAVDRDLRKGAHTEALEVAPAPVHSHLLWCGHFPMCPASQAPTCPSHEWEQCCAGTVTVSSPLQLTRLESLLHQLLADQELLTLIVLQFPHH